MATNYIALIRRADFTDLFKYGNIHINTNMTKRVSGDIRELSNSPAFFEELFYFANAFDYSYSYLLIHYKKAKSGKTNYVCIEEVQGVYPLDIDAKREFSISFDSRIKLQDPLCPNAIIDFKKKLAIKNSLKGVDNIWKIYNIPEEEKKIEFIDFPSIIKEVIDELYEDKRPSGNLDIWVYILRYERHAFYPKNTIGAFMDTTNAIFNHLKKTEVAAEEIEGTEIMKFLNCYNEENSHMNFEEILHRIYNEPKCANFIKHTQELVPHYNLIKASTLFLLYKNQYQEGFKYEEKWNNHGMSSNKEFFIACYMLGLVLGHEYTYDCLYDILQLSIFNGENTSQIDKNKKEEQTKNNKETNNISSNETKKGNVQPTIPCLERLFKSPEFESLSPKAQVWYKEESYSLWEGKNDKIFHDKMSNLYKKCPEKTKVKWEKCAKLLIKQSSDDNHYSFFNNFEEINPGPNTTNDNIKKQS